MIDPIYVGLGIKVAILTVFVEVRMHRISDVGEFFIGGSGSGSRLFRGKQLQSRMCVERIVFVDFEAMDELQRRGVSKNVISAGSRL